MFSQYKFTEEQLQSSISYACNRLQIDKPYRQQEVSLLSYLRGHDLIVALPTSAGKSLIFEAAPFCCDYLQKIASESEELIEIPEKHTVVVVSPLKSLMNIQVADLMEKGVKAAALLRESTSEIYEEVVQGKYSVVFASPEILHLKGPSLFSNDAFRQRICGIFVDEGHVVKQWGHDGGNTKAFRRHYSLISELRSLVSSKVPVSALTATATTDIIDVIRTSLALRNTVTVAESPDRGNIKLVVHHTKEKNSKKTFEWLADELKEKGQEFPRHIVYCRSHSDCSKLYGYFEKRIGRFRNRHQQTFAMYHATTARTVQDGVIDSFRYPDGYIRVLFATTAFGMGVDVKGVYTVIHYGPPKSMSEYVQESGRAGRDNKPSTSLLIHYPGSTGISRCNQVMKDFLKDDTQCRRQSVLKQFDVQKGRWESPQHRCCDLCARTCTCNIDTCNEHKFLCELAFQQETADNVSIVHQRAVTQTNMDELHQRLHSYRESCLLVLDVEGDDNHLYSGKDVASGVPRKTLESIEHECHLQFNFDQFSTRYKLFNKTHAMNIWEILQDVVGKCPRVQGPSQEVNRSTVLRAVDVDPHMDEHFTDSDEELTQQAVIYSSSESESD